MKDPCVPSLPKALLSLYWPTSLSWSSILKIKKHAYALWELLRFCCRALGLTGSIARRTLLYIVWVKPCEQEPPPTPHLGEIGQCRSTSWSSVSVNWHVVKMSRWTGEIQLRDKMYRTNRNNHAQTTYPKKLMPKRIFLLNELKKVPCKTMANGTVNLDQSQLLNENCSQRLGSCRWYLIHFKGIWIALPSNPAIIDTIASTFGHMAACMWHRSTL